MTTLAVLLLGAAALRAQTPATTPTLGSLPRRDATPLAITDVTVIDVAAGRRIPDQTVIVAGTRIAAVGATARRGGRAGVAVPAGARVIDGHGRFLTPGLADMHAHTGTTEVFYPLFLANGVTAIREMVGSPRELRLRDAVASGERSGPRSLQVGSPMVDGPHPMWAYGLAAVDPAAGRRLVDSLQTAGYGFIKVYQFLPRDTYFAVVDEARARGIPFAGHVPFEVTAAEASAAGQRSLEHLVGLGLACSSEEAALRPALADSARRARTFAEHLAVWFAGEMRPAATYSAAKCRSLFETLARNGTWVVPTLTLHRAFAFARDSSVRNDPHLRYMEADWREFSAGFASPGAAYRPAFERDLRLVGGLREAGVPLLAGTDAENPYVIPGFSLHDELALLVQAGLTPAEALRTATLNPARYLGATDSLGTVAAGKLADMVLFDADPLADIRNTRRIRAVVANGHLFGRAALDSLLDAAQRAAQPPARRP